MPVDPQVQVLLDAMAQLDATPLHEMSPTEARAMFEATRMAPPEPPTLASIEDAKVPGPDGNVVPIRVYRPVGDDSPPVCVYFHGGGWVIGSIESHDPQCRELAARSGCAVVSVEYRLAPEAKFPAPAEDCFAATAWVAEHAREIGVDGSRLAVAGDSAGGNLAAVVCQMALARGGPAIAQQNLVYPCTDHSYPFASCVDNADGFMLTMDAMRWFTGHYLNDEHDIDNPYASPLRGELAALPPALVITAELDPLRDEGEAYAAKLAAAGVPTVLHRYDGQIHGFVGLFAMLDGGSAALDESAAALRAALR